MSRTFRSHEPRTASPIDRYIAITAVATPAHLTLYALALNLTVWPAIIANLVCASLISVPSFIACKRWVWSSSSAMSVREEVLPFWLSTVVNVALASLAVHAFANSELPRWVQSVVPTVVYAITWLARFLLLDRLVFRRAHTSHP